MTKPQRSRGQERGAALFIVVLVTVLLGAIGIFAVRTSSMVERAAGFSRKSVQSLYVSDIALRTVAADIAGKEDAYKQRVQTGADQCRANENLGTLLQNNFGAGTATCWALETDELKNRLDPNLQLALALPTDPGGFIGTVIRPDQATTVEAAFRVEITDLGPAPRAKSGEDMSGKSFEYKQVTVTATGQVRPVFGTAGACTGDVAQASAVQSVRAHVTFSSQ